MEAKRRSDLAEAKHDRNKMRIKEVISDQEIELRQKSDHSVVLRRQLLQNNLLHEEELLKTRIAIVSCTTDDPTKLSSDQDQKLIDEIKKSDGRRLCEEKRRMQLRMNSHELRDLEQKLRLAHYRKDTETFLADRKTNQEVEKMKQQLEQTKETEQEIIKSKEEQQIFEQQLLEEKEKYRNFLKKQCDDAQRLRQQEYEEYLRDKLLIDEALRKIQDEDTERREAAAEKIKKNLNDLIEYQNLRDELKRRQADKLQKENEKFEVFQRQKEQEKELEQKVTEEKKCKLEMIKNEIGKKLLEENDRKSHLNETKQEIATLRHEMNQYAKEQREQERKLQMRYELNKMFVDQLDLKADIIRRQKNEEKEFNYQMLEKMEAERRIEEMNAIERRNKQLEYKQAMDKVLQDKQVQFAMRKEQEMFETQNLEELEKQQARMIEIEKIRLLKEHGPELFGFLPKDTFKSLEEIRALGPEFEHLSI